MLASFQRWRVIVTPPAAGAENMALDHALVRRAAVTGEAVLRVYAWTHPTLSLGRHQAARGIYDLESIRRSGVDVVRRPSGGGAVLHHREVTYSISAPLALVDGSEPGRHRVRDVYDGCNGLVVDALRSLGAPVVLADTGVAASWDTLSAAAGEGRDRVSAALTGSPCFDHPAPGEVVAGGRKLAGSAQWREGRAVLQHGSILIEDDQRMLGTLAPSRPPAPVATLRSLLGREPSLGEVGQALRTALDVLLAEAGRPRSSDLELDPFTTGMAEALRPQYAGDAWTWRR